MCMQIHQFRIKKILKKNELSINTILLSKGKITVIHKNQCANRLDFSHLFNNVDKYAKFDDWLCINNSDLVALAF